MRRLFFSLYSAFALAFGGVLVGLPWLVDRVMITELQGAEERIAALPQYLIEQELAGVPRLEWPEKIRQLKARFGYKLELVDVDHVAADARSNRRVRQGLPATSTAEDGFYTDTMLLPLPGSGQVVVVGFADTADERAQRGLQGFVYLIERHLTRLSSRQRQAYLEDLTRRFGVALRFVGVDDLDVSETDRRRVEAGEIVGNDVDLVNERYFVRLNVSGRPILKIGPLPHHPLLPYVNQTLIAAIALIFALGIFLWIRPLWRDMKALDRSALAFGAGELDARVVVSRRSRIGTLAATFNSMAQQIQASMFQQRELTNAVSHELRTPICRLRFAMDMLDEQPDRADRARFIDSMRSDIEELDTLVDESLTYSRMTHMRTPGLSLQRVELAQWLERALREVTPLHARVKFTLDAHAAPADAVLDPQLMARALKNILRNAYAHARTAIACTARSNGDGLYICIEDDGPGIPADQREAIFEPFYRIDESRNRELGGYGLGLAIVKRICEWHQATVTVAESALGGAKFEIFLPPIADFAVP